MVSYYNSVYSSNEKKYYNVNIIYINQWILLTNSEHDKGRAD